jgi:Mn2+/Fe2+ NRAMP family transporter
VKRLFAVALGILTAIGGFVDIGDIVANTETGARFGMSLAWVVVLGVIGICLFAEMAGRVATVSSGPPSTWSASAWGPEWPWSTWWRRSSSPSSP